jgi:peptide/nickel transport system ATP-binding protein
MNHDATTPQGSARPQAADPAGPQGSDPAHGHGTDGDRRGPAVLRIEDLHVTYHRGRRATPAVRGAGLTLHAGEAVSLVGESGSGKTTIARTVLGLLPDSATVTGSVRLGEEDLLSLSPRAARARRGSLIGYIPQDPGSSLDPIRRVLDQVTEPLRIIGVRDKTERRRRALQALRDAGLSDAERYAARWPHELSGGQRQRVLIAAAIVTEPQLLVADEPTSALDVTVQRRILDKLEEITRSTGTAILLITHDLAVAAARTTQMHVMHTGRLVESGASRRVLTHPQHEDARTLVAAIPGRGTTRLQGADAPEHRHDHTDGGALLEARGLRKTFGRGDEGVVALDGVDLSLAPGGSVAIVGESGSGKTTLARTVLGLESADEGEVLVDGTRVRSRNRAFRKLVQPVFQNPHTSFDPMHDIGWSVLEPVRALDDARPGRKERDALVASLLDDVGLDPALARRRPHELSGGQLQRAAIARALSAQPRVLLCDEAVSALDVTVQAQILQLIARLRAERELALVFITHDLAVVQETCEEIVVMHEGRVVEAGRTAQIFAAPQEDYTRDLLDAIPDPWQELAG